ncbi:mycothione reductase [Nocardioides kribbensis]|uniref:mycothione reductase n=1 Tax=Nocardioides kribbensis TaxID=305517 RepID=UPI00187A0885|nr:mycothione reductase [Nocardioides kribbensis]
MTHYDVVVLGAGSGNTVIDKSFAGLSVAIVERGPFGGTCLNRGCIPSKMLIRPADVVDAAADGPRLGARTSADGADWDAVRDRVFGRLDEVSADGRAYRESLPGVDLLSGTARFTGPRALSVELHDGATVELTADQVVLATGSRPVVPDIDGLDQVEHHTSDDVMRLETFPRRIGVVGGGYIGAELAHVFAAYGATVTQVESGEALISNQDHDISQTFTRIVSQRWDVRLGTSLQRVSRAAGGTVMHLDDGSEVEVDALLLAIGRRPNGDLLDLDRAGVETDDTGRILVDEHQRTSAEGVWALGDASSPEPLKHVANQDARVVKHNLLHPDDLRVSDHRFVPNAVFASPQVAAVGLTEAEAREQGLDLAVARHEYGDTAFGWALEADDRHGEAAGYLVKLLADRATGRLVGAHLLGPQASLLVQPLIQAMSFDQPVADLARGQYWIHPALTEVVENALLALAGELAG